MYLKPEKDSAFERSLPPIIVSTAGNISLRIKGGRVPCVIIMGWEKNVIFSWLNLSEVFILEDL